MVKKLKVFFLPFVAFTVLLCGGYTLLNWLLVIRLQLVSVNEIITQFALPAIIPAIPYFLYFRPRLRLLNLRTEKRDLSDLYAAILWIALTVPTIVAQTYIEKATGKLTAVTSVDEIRKKESTKYYTLKNVYLDKQAAGATSDFDVSGRYNEHFDMKLYVAIPLLKEAGTATDESNVWLGEKFTKEISNRLEQDEKEKAFKEFAAESQKFFDEHDYSTFRYLERVGNSNDHELYVEAIKTSDSTKATGNAIILKAINEPFEARLGNTLAWIFGSFGIGALVWLIMVAIPKYDDSAEAVYAQDDGGWTIFLDLLKPKEGFTITPIIIYLNIGVYVAMVVSGLGFISFKSTDLLNWGANFRPNTVNGQWWRLLTSTFLHGGIMHLLANMYGLLFVGVFLEPLLGKLKYSIAYLLTGVIASAASIWWYDATVSVGASGAIFGLYGVFIALLVTKVFHPDFAKSFLVSTGIFVGFNLLMGLSAGGGIDNAAHISGLISGFAIGLLLRLTLKPVDEGEMVDIEG